MMLEAYATGFPIRISAYGTSAAAAGDGTVVGFTRPWAHAGVEAPRRPTKAGARPGAIGGRRVSQRTPNGHFGFALPGLQ